MESGKLKWKDLSLILKENKGILRDEIKVRNSIGEDSAVIDFGKYECVISTDPITATSKNIGKLAVHINCNDIASCGVEPLAMLVTILAPENSTLNDIKDIMEEMSEECKKINIEIIGGHTEVTDAVNKIVVSCTVLGKCLSGRSITSSNAKVNDSIIVTKSLGLEGTTIIINENLDRCKRILTKEEIKEGLLYIDKISVIKEGVIAANSNVNAMHDITEGGALGALFEVCEASNVGFLVQRDKMPITEVTNKICKEFNIDPLRLISSGSMLIVASNGEEVLKNLKDNDIHASIIGKITNDKKILKFSDKEIEVLPKERDELFDIQ